MAHYTATVLDDNRIQLPFGALNFVRPGQEIEIEIEEVAVTPSHRPNEAILSALNEIASRQEGRPESDNSQTLRYIQEGRDGAMYDYNPGHEQEVSGNDADN
ncbi:MAG: hypothetical protein ACLQVD_01755 [Capsulimonadaceae bacterium]